MQLSLPLFLLLAVPAMADSRDSLIQAMESSGSHEYEDERREVKIDGCQMTTFRWREIPEHGWVLWTSFQFNMDDAQLDEDKRFKDKRYAYAKLEDGPPEIGFAFYGFTLREGTFARQERSVLREPEGETEPSPRGDGTTHYYQQMDSILISMKGPGVEEKAIAFTASYVAYVNEYCTSSS
jgi:hypothetical protein